MILKISTVKCKYTFLAVVWDSLELNLVVPVTQLPLSAEVAICTSASHC